MSTDRVAIHHVAAVIALGLLLTGCSSPLIDAAVTPVHKIQKPLSKPVRTPTTMPQFENLLLMDPTPLVSTLNVVPVVSKSADQHIRVQDAVGHWTTLDAAKRPTLFVAYWCPHCQRTLVLLRRNAARIKQWPNIVLTGYPANVPLQWARALVTQEEHSLQLPFLTHAYFMLGTADMTYITGFPYLMFEHQGALGALVGEHTFRVWQQALASRSADTSLIRAQPTYNRAN